jgi:hypothetical protein
MTPDFMPVLSAGSHKSPAEGACVMEYISFLAGEEFSEFPQCTARPLARMAQIFNDSLPDDRRHEMLEYITRLMGSYSSNKHHYVLIAQWCASEAKKSAASSEANAATTWAANAATAATWAANAATAWAANAATAAAANAATAAWATVEVRVAASEKFFNDLLDKWDEITGRTEFAKVTNNDFQKMKELVSNG